MPSVTRRTPKVKRLTFHVSLLFILLAAFFLRVYQLDSQSLRGDEAATVLYSAMPVSELWELSRVTDPHPPLYYALLHPWQWLAGESAWAMRFIGAAAATLTVAALYALARHTLPLRGVSRLAMALLALNPLQIWLAQDVRSYPFFTLLGLLSSWALWQALSESGCVRDFRGRGDRPAAPTGNTKNFGHPPESGRRPPVPGNQSILRFTSWFIYVFLTVVCFYTHYYTAFLIAFQGLFVLLNARAFWKQKWPWLASQVAIGLLIIPGLQLAYKFVGGEAAGGIDTLPLLDILRLASTALLTGFTISDTWGGWASLLLAPVWIIGLIMLLRRDRLSGSFWMLFFAAPVLGVIALSIDRPFFKERFLIQAQPAFELLLAWGIGGLWRITGIKGVFKGYAGRFISILLLAFLIGVNVLALYHYWADPAYTKAPPWRLYHDYVSGHARPGDVMLTNFPEAAVSYYSPNDLPFYVVPVERDRPAEERQEQTAQIAGAYQRVWFLPLLRQGFDEPGEVLNWLDRHADRVNQIFFPDYNLNLYLTPPTLDSLLVSQPVTFTHGLHLRGYQILDKKGQSRLSTLPSGEPLLTLKPEDDFTLSLYWQAAGPTAAPYTVFVHLLAADGFNRTSQDNQPVWGSYPTSLWQPGEKVVDRYTLTLPPGTPPGDHHLHIGWYNPATQERGFVLDNQGQPAADHVVLSVIVRVEPDKKP